MNKSDSKLEPIVIVGRSCRLPGANDLHSYWELIESGRCAQAPIPESRLDRRLLFCPEKGRQGTTYADFACLVEYPNVSRPECQLPHFIKKHPERTYATLASVAFDAVQDAQLDPTDLPNRNLGVYVGHTRASGLSGDIAFANYIGEIAELLGRVPTWRKRFGGKLIELQQRLVEEVRDHYPHKCSAPLGAGCSAKVVSDALQATGPYMAMNAACASSTQALIQAVRALQLGRVDFALAGGGSYCHSDTLVLFSQAQSLSASGTRPWDGDADGLVLGEGYVTLLLCRQSSAIELGLPIHAVIRGIGLSSDGKGKSLWAPRKEGQVLAIERAYQGRLSKRDVGYIEAHATSTQLGDATEIEALAESYRSDLMNGRRIPIGSVKANIGHTLETAGIAGLLKCLLAMEREKIPAVRHIKTPNSKIDWDRLPFELPANTRRWEPTNEGWIAGVNAFGIGGLNTHLVIQRMRGASTQIATPLGIGMAGSTRLQESKSDSDRVVIVSVGAILAGSPNTNAFWDLVAKGLSAIRPVPSNRWSENAYPVAKQYCNRTKGSETQSDFSVRSRLGGVITDYVCDWRKAKIPPKQIAHASPLQFMILDAVQEAWERSKIEFSEQDRKRTGVVTGTSFGGEFSNQLQMGLRLPELRQRLERHLELLGIPENDRISLLEDFSSQMLEKMPALLDETGSFTSSSLASRVTKNFNLMGGATAVDSGAASFGAALSCCVDQLLAGDNDFMVCIGAQQDLGPSRFVGMTLAGILGDTQGEDGVYPGEGCVVLILERESDAIRRGHPIMAVIESIGTGYETNSAHISAQIATRRSSALVDSASALNVDVDDVACIQTTLAVEQSRTGDSSRDTQVKDAICWSLRNQMGGNWGGQLPTDSIPIEDSSKYVGHLAGGSLAVNLLAALGSLHADSSSPTVERNQNQIEPPRRLHRRRIVGGGSTENIYEIVIRNFSA